MTKNIVLASGKGGVGKTISAINLGSALTAFGRDVAVLDANFANPNVGLYLGSPMLKYTLYDALNGSKSINEVTYLHSSGLKVIPSNIFAQDFNYKNLGNVLLDIYGHVDAIIVDSSNQTDHLTAAIKCADGLIIVTNPELPSVYDALKVVKIANRFGCGILGILINRVKNSRFEMTSENVSSFLDNPVIGVIPEDSEVGVSVGIKSPVVFSQPYSKASIAFKKFAANLIGEEYKVDLKKQKINRRL